MMLDCAGFPQLDFVTPLQLLEERYETYGGPEVTWFTSEFLRSLPDKNRAMYKYVWLRHVREYEEYMRQHPELDRDLT